MPEDTTPMPVLITAAIIMWTVWILVEWRIRKNKSGK